MYGIFSNHSLSDPTAYPDDVIVHTADQDCFPYYRRMDSLEDDTSMEESVHKKLFDAVMGTLTPH